MFNFLDFPYNVSTLNLMNTHESWGQYKKSPYWFSNISPDSY